MVTLLDDKKKDGEEGYCVFSVRVKLSHFFARLDYYLGRSERERLSMSVRLRSKKHSYGLHRSMYFGSG